MIAVHIKDLATLRKLIAENEWEERFEAIAGIRTPIAYAPSGLESIAFVRTYDEVADLVEGYPDVAAVYTPEQIAGYRRQVVIDDVPQWREVKTEDGVTREPVTEDVPPEAEARTAYDRCYPRTPYAELDEDGKPTGRNITPPFWFGWINNQDGTNLLRNSGSD